jgi:hypothetical protein
MNPPRTHNEPSDSSCECDKLEDYIIPRSESISTPSEPSSSAEAETSPTLFQCFVTEYNFIQRSMQIDIDKGLALRKPVKEMRAELARQKEELLQQKQELLDQKKGLERENESIGARKVNG